MSTTSSEKAQKFFEQTLPARVASQLEQHLATQGKISFEIGDQSWTFRFGDEVPVVPGLDEDAGLKMSFDPAAFDAFLANNLDLPMAVNAGTIRANGDFSILKSFGLFIEASTPKANIGWNFS